MEPCSGEKIRRHWSYPIAQDEKVDRYIDSGTVCSLDKTKQDSASEIVSPPEDAHRLYYPR